MKEGIQYISELNNSLNEIRIVTGQSEEQVKSLAKSYNDLARQMSVSTKDIASTAVDLYRQGLTSVGDVNERMQAIIKYAKISSLSLADSNKIITATMNATGESAQKVTDIFSYLGDVTSSGADEIGQAMQKVASTNDGIGVSFEKAASWIAVISSKTREGASQIGTSLKSLESRYTSIKEKGFNSEDATDINQVTKALTAAGIQATTADGQLRNFADVIDELGKKYSTLDEKTKNYVMTALGGTYQMNRLRALMDGYAQSTDLYATSLSQVGIANQKFNIWQESTAAKMDKLKASWEGFWQSSLDSGLIKGTLDAANSLTDTFANLPTVLQTIVTATALWKGTKLTEWLRTVGITTGTFRTTLIATRGATLGMTEAEIAAATATKGWALSWNALKVAFLSNPLGFIATGVMAIVTAIDIFNQKQEEAKRKIEESAQSALEESNNLKELLAQYNDLGTSLNQDESSRKQLQTVQEQIIKLLGLENDALIKVNGTYDENIKKINEKSQAQLKANQQTLQAAYNLAQEEAKNINGASSSWRALGGDADYFANGFSQNSKYNKEIVQILKNAEIKDLQIDNGQINNLANGAEARIKVVQQAIDVLEKEGKASGDIYNQLVASRDKYQDAINKENSALTELNKNLALQATLAAQIQYGNPNADNFKKFKDNIVETIAKQQGLNKVSEDFRKIIYEQIDNMFPSLAKATKETLGTTDNFASVLSTLQSKLQETDAEGKKNNDSLSASFGRIEESVADVNNAIDKLNKGESLTEDEIASLIMKHQELAGNLVEVNGVYTLRLDVLERVRKSELDTQIAAFESANAIKENEWQVIKDRLAQYGIFYSKLSDMSSQSLNTDINKKISEQGQKGNVANVIELAQLKEDTTGLMQYLDTLSDLDKLKDNLTGKKKASKSTGTSSTSKTLTQQEEVDQSKLTEAFIKSANAQAQNTAEANKHLEAQMKIADKAKDYRREIELTNELIKGQTQEVADLESAQDKLHSKAEQLRKDNAQYNVESWYDANGESTSAFDTYIVSFTQAKNKIIEEMNKLESKSNLTKTEKERLVDLKNQVNAIDSQQKHVEDLFTSIQQLKKAWQENEDAITATNDAIDSSKITIGEKINEISKAIKSEVSDYKHGLEELMDAEEERHKKVLDQIDDEKDKFNDYIDGQIEAIDRLKDEQNYNSDISDITKEIAKLQAQKNELAMAAASGDTEVISMIDDIDKEIADKQKDLAKKQDDEEYRRRKQNLQDIKKNYDEDADAKKEAENDKYEAIKSNYDKLLNDISLFTDSSTSLNTSMVDNMITDYNALSESFTGNVQKMAKVFQDQFISKLQNARLEISNLNSLAGGGKGTTPPPPTTPKSSSKDHRSLGDGFEKMTNAEFAQYVENKRKWDLGTISEAELEYNKKLRQKYGIKSDKYFYKDLVGYYANGGINTATGLAMLHGSPTRPEFIFNTDQLKNLVTNLAFKIPTPNLNIPQLTGNNGVSLAMGDIKIYAQSVDEKSIPKLVDEVAKVFRQNLNMAGIVKRG